jgi:hypothetical protein
MATLNINGKRVKVSDDFLRMTPEQQNAAVEEIAASIGGQPPAPAPAAVGPATPPPGLKPGTREYADWAAQAARAGQTLPQVSNPEFTETQSSILDPFVQGTTFGWGDELRGAVQGGLAAMQGGDFGSVYDQTVDESRNALEHERRVNPWGSIASEMGGALATTALGGRVLGPVAGAAGFNAPATLLGRTLLGGVSGAAQGGLYGAGAADGNLGDRAKGGALGAGIGGVVGAAIPLASNAIAQMGQRGQQAAVLNAAAKAAPSADDLKSSASAMFEQATGGTPLAVSDNAYMRFLGEVDAVGRKLRINQNLDPKSVGLSEMMMSIADDLAQGGTVVDLKDLHLIRQAAQRVAMSSEGRDAAFASTVINKLDDFIQGLKPADILGGADPSQATKALFDGISTWSRANKVSLIEEAIRKGQSAASGPEKGIRNALRAATLNRPDVWRRFTAAEQQAIRDVIDGTPGSNLMKLVGTFGFGGNTATNGIGGAAGMALGGMAGGPIGMVAGPVLGSVGRKASENMTNSLAQRAVAAAAADGLKIVPPVNPNQATMLEQVLMRTALPALPPLIQSR